MKPNPDSVVEGTSGKFVRGSGTRLKWVDASRGISIILVVLLHATSWAAYTVSIPKWMTDFNDTLAPMRMPLFFCVSGILAHKWVNRSWNELYTGKVAILIWTFLLWQPSVFTYKVVAGKFLPDQANSGLVDNVLRLSLTLVRPNGELWFLWALCLFLVGAKAISRFSKSVQFVFASAISIVWYFVAGNFITDSQLRVIGDGWDGALGLFVFFLGGVIYREYIKQGMQSASIGVAIIGVLISGGILYGYYYFELSSVFSAPYMVRFAGLVCGFLLAAILSRFAIVTYCGSVTLPIYLAHSLFIVLGCCAVAGLAGTELKAAPSFVVLVPFVLSVFSIAASLIIYRLRGWTLGKYLYAPPRWFSHVDRSVRIRFPK